VEKFRLQDFLSEPPLQKDILSIPLFPHQEELVRLISQVTELDLSEIYLSSNDSYVLERLFERHAKNFKSYTVSENLLHAPKLNGSEKVVLPNAEYQYQEFLFRIREIQHDVHEM